VDRLFPLASVDNSGEGGNSLTNEDQSNGMWILGGDLVLEVVVGQASPENLHRSSALCLIEMG
jgi:hypothetical protein